MMFLVRAGPALVRAGPTFSKARQRGPSGYKYTWLTKVLKLLSLMVGNYLYIENSSHVHNLIK